MKISLRICLCCLFGLTTLDGFSQMPNGFRKQIIKVDATLEHWLNTGIVVNEGDFVIFEVTGTISVGPFLGNAKGHGLPITSYRVEKSCWHAALMCKNGNEIVEARRYGKLGLDDKLAWSTGLIKYDFIGYYFVSNSNQQLSLRINDSEPKNNKGSFTVEITVIPQTLHIKRNMFNKCPLVEPKEINGNYVDNAGNYWTSGINEAYYHGGGVSNLLPNKTYRAEGTKSPSISGCQCVYANGKLVNDNIYMGTYDYAFGIKNLNNTDKYHVLWDWVIHDAYINYYEKNNRRFKYDPTEKRY